jgi:hypothetical protein
MIAVVGEEDTGSQASTRSLSRSPVADTLRAVAPGGPDAAGRRGSAATDSDPRERGMDVTEAVVRSLRPYTWGWQANIPAVSFLGKSVGLRVDTQPEPSGGPSPPPDEAELALVRLVLGALPELLPEIERHYREHADSPKVLDRADEPRVWVSRDMSAEEGPTRWAFVTGIADAPDWTIQAVFDVLTFREMWSGD